MAKDRISDVGTASALIYSAGTTSLLKVVFDGYDNKKARLDAKQQIKFDRAVHAHLVRLLPPPPPEALSSEQTQIAAQRAHFEADAGKTAGQQPFPNSAAKALRATWESAWNRTSAEPAATRYVTEGAWREEIWLTYNCPKTQFIRRCNFQSMEKESLKTKATVELHPSSSHGATAGMPQPEGTSRPRPSRKTRPQPRQLLYPHTLAQIQQLSVLRVAQLTLTGAGVLIIYSLGNT
jgi:hypothetical protein